MTALNCMSPVSQCVLQGPECLTVYFFLFPQEGKSLPLPAGVLWGRRSVFTCSVGPEDEGHDVTPTPVSELRPLAHVSADSHATETLPKISKHWEKNLRKKCKFRMEI